MNNGKYKSTAVASYIINRARDANIYLNITKLQKLLYAAYGVYLEVKNERLTDESPQAWPYGPVFPDARKAFLKFNFAAGSIPDGDKRLKVISEDEDIRRLIDIVFNAFGKWTAGQLTEWSHQEGSPWEKTRCNNADFKWGENIPDVYIKEYFSTILVRNDGKGDKRLK